MERFFAKNLCKINKFYNHNCQREAKQYLKKEKGEPASPLYNCYAQIYSLRCVIRLPIWGLENCASAPTLSPFLRICSFMSDENSSTGIL